MARIAALGEPVRIQGYGLVGVLTVPAEDPPAVRAAWSGLGPEVGAVILTPAAAEALGEAAVDTDRLVVVLP